MNLVTILLTVFCASGVLLLMLVLWGACAVSGNISREEERRGYE